MSGSAKIQDRGAAQTPLRLTPREIFPQSGGKGMTAGLFNALFFGVWGRVSLQCHMPVQTAL
jgi:hypothetical protein